MESAISWREGVLISIIIHMAMVILLLTAPDWVVARRVIVPADAAASPVEDKDEPLRFVFVQPRVDVPAAAPPPRAEASDRDRVARTPERADDPANQFPLSRGNSPERVELTEQELARGRGATPDPSAGPLEPPEAERDFRVPEQQSAMVLPTPAPQTRSGAEGRAPSGGSLGDALRNLERYVQNEQFHNPLGSEGAFGPAIQFDTMGVEFGPWIRRFIAQVKGNWLVPLAAMSLHGHVVLTFNVHKNGFITDLGVVKPSAVDAFNNAAFGALVSSSPTLPLPPEYPADKAFFTVTFFYNETPP